MKKFSIFCILMMTLTFAKSQSIKIIFDHIQNNDFILEKVPTLKFSDYLLRYSLLIDSQKTKFTLDSIFIKNCPDMFKSFLAAQEIYTDFKESKWLSCNGRYRNGLCLFVDLADCLNKTATWQWEITDEKQEIIGMVCTKAVYKNNIAWFTEEISLPIAPGNKLFSLPGAVLKYVNISGEYTAISIEKVTQKVTFPKVLVSDEEGKITKSFSEMDDQPLKNIFLISTASPTNKWIPIQYKVE